MPAGTPQSNLSILAWTLVKEQISSHAATATSTTADQEEISKIIILHEMDWNVICEETVELGVEQNVQHEHLVFDHPQQARIDW
jgi:hypothetical protein